MVDTRKIAGRRRLRFQSLDEIVADAERLVAARQVKTLGNWSLGQILQHLASGMNAAIDGVSFRAPWWVRLLGPFLKARLLNHPMAPGFKMPAEMARQFGADEATTAEAGMAALRDAVRRLQTEPLLERHPVFGRMTKQEWERLHLRHAELHLSFVQPVD